MRLFVSLMLSSSVALAQMGPIPGEERFTSAFEEQPNSAGGGLGFGKIGDDWFLQLQLATALNLGKVGIGFRLPLNLHLLDSDGEFGGMELREQDWDEISDYLKIIRYVRYGHKHGSELLYVRVGEIAADLGHGTIMGRYLNNVDVNTFRLGSQLDVYTNYGGVETVISDYGSLFGDTPDSQLVGARAYVKPVALADPQSPLNIFAVGVSVVSDINAPRALDPTGALDDVGNFEVAKDDANTVYGFDLEAQVVNTPIIKLTPYTDVNFIGGGGWGVHVGALFIASMPIGFDLTIPIRLEYRHFAADYLPAYFSTFYELERYAYPLGEDNAVPKAAYIRAQKGDGLDGVYGDMAFDFLGLFQLGAIYEGYNGEYPNLAAFLNVPALEVFKFKAYYTRSRVEDLGDLFALDNRSLLIAEVRYQMVTYVYLVGRFTRRWVPATGGEWRSEDDWNVGVEMAFTF